MVAVVLNIELQRPDSFMLPKKLCKLVFEAKALNRSYKY